MLVFLSENSESMYTGVKLNGNLKQQRSMNLINNLRIILSINTTKSSCTRTLVVTTIMIPLIMISQAVNLLTETCFLKAHKRAVLLLTIETNPIFFFISLLYFTPMHEFDKAFPQLAAAEADK